MARVAERVRAVAVAVGRAARRGAGAVWVRRGELVVDVLGVAGLGAVAKGAHDVYAPAAWLVVGAGLLAYAVTVAVKGVR